MIVLGRGWLLVCMSLDFLKFKMDEWLCSRYLIVDTSIPRTFSMSMEPFKLNDFIGAIVKKHIVVSDAAVDVDGRCRYRCHRLHHNTHSVMLLLLLP